MISVSRVRYSEMPSDTANTTRPRSTAGVLNCWFILLVWSSVSQVVTAQSDAAKPLYEREPFDRITLTAAHDSAVVEIVPIQSIDRSQGVRGSNKSLFTIRRLQDAPDQLFRVNKRDIETFELFHEMLRDEARELVAAKKVDEAFPFIARLVNDFPDTEGLEALVEEFYFADARHLFEMKRFDESLVSLNEVYSRNPDRPGLGRVIQRLLGEIIRLEYRAGRFESVLRKTRYARERYGEVAAQLVTEWEKRLEAVAAERLATAKSAFARGDAIAALAASRAAIQIWPSDEEAVELQRAILKQYPRVRVGVSQPYTPVTPGVRSAPRILHWATRRTEPLLQRNLIEFEAFTVEGGTYFSPLGKLQVDSNRQQLSLTFDAGAGAYALCRALLRMADPQDEHYSARWEEFLDSIFVPNAGTVEVSLNRPLLLPQSSLPRRVPVTDGLREALQGTFTLEETVDSANELNFRLREDLKAGENGVTQIVERHFEEPGAMADALLAGEIDVIDRVEAGDLRRLRASQDVEVVAYQIPTVHFLVFGSREPMLRNSTFRRGLVYGINRPQFLRQFEGTARLISGPLPRGQSQDDPLGYAYSRTVGPRDYDPSLARVLLRLAQVEKQILANKSGGAPKEEAEAVESEEAVQEEPLPPLVIACPDSPVARAGAAAVRFDLQRLGLQTSLRFLRPGRAVPEDDDWDVLYVEASIEDPFVDFPELILGHSLLGRHGGLVWQATRALQEASNLEDVRTQFAKIHKLAFDHTPLLPLWQIVEHVAYRKEVDGIPESPATLYQNVSNWRFVP